MLAVVDACPSTLRSSGVRTIADREPPTIRIHDEREYMNIASVLRKLSDSDLIECATAIPESTLAKFLRELPDAKLVTACGGASAPKAKASTPAAAPKARTPKEDPALVGDMEAVYAKLPGSASSLSEATGLADARTAKVLAALVASGKVVRVGKGRGTSYAHAPATTEVPPTDVASTEVAQ